MKENPRFVVVWRNHTTTNLEFSFSEITLTLWGVATCFIARLRGKKENKIPVVGRGSEATPPNNRDFINSQIPNQCGIAELLYAISLLLGVGILPAWDQY
ncbi:MAG: hypothetical protein MUF49_18460 [Oculatellaceae cyanobacterium Prado106]|jgi:hypothetical protein|nr:hypothetical protein [Oculatellaceae cyanobacterium Prado106]